MRSARTTLARAIATWFGCGRAPWGPGTMGTLGALPLYALSIREGRLSLAGVALAVGLTGVWAASVVERETGTHDPPFVVVDEVAGLLITMLPIRAFSWRATAAGFVLFRLLDIFKPWPIRRFERLPSGWGIVMDDVVAGVVAAAVMYALRAGGVLAA